MADCVTCGRPQSGTAYVCPRCAGRARGDLLRLASLASELDVTIARQGRAGDGGRGGDDEPLPVDLGAAEQAWAVTNTVTTWIRDVARARGVTALRYPRTPGPTCRTNAGVPACGHRSCLAIARSGQPLDGLAEAIRWLAGQVEWIRHQPDAGQALDELADACAVAVRIVDRRAPRWYAGPCGAVPVDGHTACPQDLYAAPGATVVRCGACGARYDAAGRREWLLAEARDYRFHAEMIGRALAALGLDVTPARVRVWAARGHIVAHGSEQAGQRTRPLYRVGDVEDVARRMAARRVAA